jgi:beta-lactamase class A
MSLQEQIEAQIQTSGAKVGVAIHHVETGDEVMINAGEYFPMASVFKIPILVETCFRLAEDRMRSGDRWVLKTEDKNLPSGVLTFFEDGLTPTVQDLLTMMIIISDNTATDILIKRLGKEQINQRMRSLGLENIHTRMTVRELFEEILPNADPTQDLYALDKEETEIKRDLTNRVYHLAPDNNVTTPRDMASLLRLVWEGKTPDRTWSDYALNILLKQQLNDRLPRFLPSGTRVAHKTGTLRCVRNDAGIIYASENSHVIVSTFVFWDEEMSLEDPRIIRRRSFAMDELIGDIARLAFDQYQ